MNDTTRVWLLLGLAAACLLAYVGIQSVTASQAAQREGLIAAHRQAMKAIYPGWPWDLLDAGTITLGMSEDMAMMALGDPDIINETVDVSGSHVQWAYRPHSDENTQNSDGSWNVTVSSHRMNGIDHRATHAYEYVYFDNGILTAWQD